jgi:antitoxin component HigA of HigAB toxin-antitoxin module
MEPMTEAEYRQALRSIEELWGAERGTSEFDHLEKLVEQVEAYERVYHPIPKPSFWQLWKYRIASWNWIRRLRLRLGWDKEYNSMEEFIDDLPQQ